MPGKSAGFDLACQLVHRSTRVTLVSIARIDVVDVQISVAQYQILSSRIHVRVEVNYVVLCPRRDNHVARSIRRNVASQQRSVANGDVVGVHLNVVVLVHD